MQDVGLNRLFAFVSHCHVALDRSGLHVEQATHMNDVAQAGKRLGIPGLTRTLDPALSDFTRTSVMWLLVYHRAPTEGPRRLVGMVGARREDLTKGEFAPALANRMNRLYGSAGAPALEDAISPPIFDEMSGRIAYVDGLHIHPDFRGEGGLNIRALLLLLFAYARVEWDFDWLYGFVRADHAERDYLSTYCFANTYPAALAWNIPVSDRSNDDIFGCSSRDDFAYLTDLIARRPALLEQGEMR